ncbi:unnamed protein product [Cuscuta epithymum]|uniref:Reverse transcriptase Ty1/copia-type domain-containing protein n=1 Tax=Cuscuta epithymum TaxID=186058 RepID=A0AAV0FAC7_9ASTE|nr:unnamed protein product [Cuscuta epithymum]
MFVYRSRSQTVYILLYVDDILLIGSSFSFVRSIINTLSRQFARKNLRNIHYFLGIQARRNSQGLFISQEKYITDLLRHFHLHTVKPVRTPPPSHITLSLTDEELLSDGTEYHSMIDANWAGCPDSSRSTPGYAVFLARILFLGGPRSNRRSQSPSPKLNTEPSLAPFRIPNLFGLFLWIWGS